MPKAKPIKVRVTLTVEVDPWAWQLMYGTNPTEVRDDVHNFVHAEIACSSPVEEGAILSVKLASPAWTAS